MSIAARQRSGARAMGARLSEFPLRCRLYLWESACSSNSSDSPRRARRLSASISPYCSRAPVAAETADRATRYHYAASNRFSIAASVDRRNICPSFREVLPVSQIPPPQGPIRYMSSRDGRSKGGGKKSKSGGKNRGRGGSASSAAGGGGASLETTEPVLTFNGVSKQLPGGRQLFNEASLTFMRGAKVGVLGVNGSGKSTVLKILAGEDKEFDGELWTREGLRVKYLQQEPDLDTSLTVMENIRRGIAEQEAMVARFEATGLEMGEPDADLDALLEEQAALQAKIEDADAWNLQHRVEIAMMKLRVPPGDSSVGQLSGGEKRRVALCRLLLEQPDVILLDEPTNHLDAESVQWLEDYLRAFKGTVISITHDRYFLDNVAGWILEVDRGSLLPYEGNYSSWLVQKQKRLDMEHSKQAQMAKILDAELKWIQNGRASVSKARAKNYEKALAERREGGAKLRQLAEGMIVIPPGPRLGRTVLTVNSLSKAYGERTLFSGLSFTVDAGAVVGVVGPNGSGKSTLFNLIAGLQEADEGTVEWGPSTKVGLVSQGRGELDPEKTAYEEISQGQDTVQIGDRQVNIRTYTAAFNLRGAAQEKLVGNMSGGERNRVHLAKVLKEGNNVLLLDEPTNDLDVETLRSLEEAIHGFAGSVLIVSHDRWFLDRVCSHTIAFEDNPQDGDGGSGAMRAESKVVVFPGNHGDHEKAGGGVVVCDNLIGGESTPPASGKYLDVISPSDGTVLGRVAMSGAQEVTEAVAQAEQAFGAWSGMTAKSRAAVMFRFHALLEKHADELADLVVAENGKNKAEALASVAKGNETVEWACSMPQLMQGKILQVSRGIDCQDLREPLGVVASLVPFNFPIMVPMWTVPIALTAGNCVILKPSEKVPLTMRRVGQLLAEAGIPPGVFQIVNGGREAAEALCDSKAVKALTFVGSSGVARAVAERCHAVNKRVLALGGAENHLVILPDCDHEATAHDVVASFAGCAGQRCMAASVLVLVGDTGDLLMKVEKKAKALAPGTEAGEVGPVISAASRDHIVDCIAKEEAAGGKVLVDGRSWAERRPGTWLGPTVILRTGGAAAAVAAAGKGEEVFGPVLMVVKVETWQDALAVENASPFGNAASIYTASGAAAAYFQTRFRAGMVGINVGIPVPREPFAFGGLSGSLSKYGDFDVTAEGAMEFFTNRRKITTKWALPAEAMASTPAGGKADTASFVGRM